MSSMDTCQLFCKGVPGARYGRLSKDKSGPLRSFIVDSTQQYGIVLKHVKHCAVCDPNEVLRAYIEHRSTPKKGGMMSAGLVDLARRMNKIKGKPVDPEIYREFLWRQPDLLFLARSNEITALECVKGLALYFDYRKSLSKTAFSARQEVRSIIFSPGDRVEIARLVAELYDRGDIYDKDGKITLDDRELQNLIVITDVMYT